MKWLLAGGIFLIAIILALIAYGENGGFWQSMLISLAGSFIAVGVGLIIVNIYLEKRHKKSAVSAILHFSHDAIRDFHNTLLDIIWTRFGSNEFERIRASYIDSDGDVTVIKPDDRDKLYALAKERETELLSLIDRLDETLSDMTFLIGWDLSPDLLAFTLNARQSMRQYKGIKMDDSDETKRAVVESLIDVDNFTNVSRSILMELAGEKD